MPAVRRPRVALAALLLVGPLGLSGCDAGSPPDGSSGRSSAAPSTPSATPLSAFDTAGLTVPRADFCAQVAPVDAQRALGGEVARSTSYGNGEPAPLSRGVRDISHEFGCTWTATDGTRARAWVFTPPVTRARAKQLAADATTGGCRSVGAAPSFGAPGAAVRCKDDRRVRVVFSGLFGDAWLSCELDVARRDPTGGLVDRTGQWCVTVAQAASAES
jgi:hypothetical protein